MAEYVCPECGDKIKGSSNSEVAIEAMDHMKEEHGKDNITREYVMENIDAH